MRVDAEKYDWNVLARLLAIDDGSPEAISDALGVTVRSGRRFLHVLTGTSGGERRSITVRRLVERAVGQDLDPVSVGRVFDLLRRSTRRLRRLGLEPECIELARWLARVVHVPTSPHLEYFGPPLGQWYFEVIGMTRRPAEYGALLEIASRRPELALRDPALQALLAAIALHGKLRLESFGRRAADAVDAVVESARTTRIPRGDSFRIMHFHSALHGDSGFSREFLERFRDRDGEFIRDVGDESARWFGLPGIGALVTVARAMQRAGFYRKSPQIAEVAERMCAWWERESDASSPAGRD